MLAGGAALGLLGVVASACGSPPPNVDDLQLQLQAARHDHELATAATAAATPQMAAALTTIAAQRSDHAQALATEIARVTGGPSTTAPTSTDATAQAGPAPSVPDVVNALHTAAQHAATLAAGSSGYRAGLLGSIAAACTAASTVALADKKPEAAPPADTSSTPDAAGDAALAAALTTEHSAIYGYGMVSAHSTLDVNDLVADALHQHRGRREQVVTMLTQRSATAPVAATGYHLPMPVNNPTDAAQLAVRMEHDTAVAWRAVLEQAETSEDRAFAASALTQSAVLAARWNQVLGLWPLTEAFPGEQT